MDSRASLALISEVSVVSLIRLHTDVPRLWQDKISKGCIQKTSLQAAWGGENLTAWTWVKRGRLTPFSCKQALLWSSPFHKLPKTQCQKSVTVLWWDPRNENRFCTMKKATLLHCLHPRFARLFLSAYNRKLWQEAPEVQADTTHPPPTRLYTHCYHFPPTQPAPPFSSTCRTE